MDMYTLNNNGNYTVISQHKYLICGLHPQGKSPILKLTGSSDADAVFVRNEQSTVGKRVLCYLTIILVTVKEKLSNNKLYNSLYRVLL